MKTVHFECQKHQRTEAVFAQQPEFEQMLCLAGEPQDAQAGQKMADAVVLEPLNPVETAWGKLETGQAARHFAG